MTKNQFYLKNGKLDIQTDVKSFKINDSVNKTEGAPLTADILPRELLYA